MSPIELIIWELKQITAAELIIMVILIIFLSWDIYKFSMLKRWRNEK